MQDNLLVENNSIAQSLLLAASQQKWYHVRENLNNLSNEDINFTLDEGKTISWYAADANEWDIVRDIITIFLNTDINAAPKFGEDEGKTVLWLAVYYQQWDLVREILDIGFEVKINAAPVKGRDQGKSILWLATYYEKWDIVDTFLENCDEIDVNAAPAKGSHKKRTVINFIIDYDKFEIATKLLQHSTTLSPDIFKLFCPLDDNKFEQIIFAVMKNYHFKNLRTLEIGAENELSDRSAQLLKNIVKTNPNLISVNLQSNKITDSKIQELMEFVHRNFVYKQNLDEINHLLNKVESQFQFRDNIIVEVNKADEYIDTEQVIAYLKQALEQAKGIEQYGHQEVVQLIHDIKNKIFNLYCYVGEAEEAFIFIKNELSQINTATKAIFYSEIGKSFYLNSTKFSEIQEDRYKELVKSLAFLSEALSLNKDNAETKLLIENAYNGAIGNRGIVLSFKEIQEHPNFFHILHDVVNIKQELFGEQPKYLDIDQDIIALSDFIQSDNVPILQGAFNFFQKVFNRQELKRKAEVPVDENSSSQFGDDQYLRNNVRQKSLVSQFFEVRAKRKKQDEKDSFKGDYQFGQSFNDKQETIEQGDSIKNLTI